MLVYVLIFISVLPQGTFNRYCWTSLHITLSIKQAKTVTLDILIYCNDILCILCTV